jgi:hypothetical protein
VSIETGRPVSPGPLAGGGDRVEDTQVTATVAVAALVVIDER